MSETAIDDAQESADFASGFEGKPTEKPSQAKVETPAETPREETPEPEFVRITKKDWDEISAAARRTASYDQQFSKLFGTTGNIQKLLTELQSKNNPQPTPPGKKIEIPKDAFAAMEKDFPELAQQNRAALEAALSGIALGEAPEANAAKIEKMLADITVKRQIEELEDVFPDWKTIVGAVNANTEQPDPENPFRKWLATKDATYQARINDTQSAAVIARAIRLFQKETEAPAKPVQPPRNSARAAVIAAAVQPKGDGAPAGPAKTDQDEFLAGFNSR